MATKKKVSKKKVSKKKVSKKKTAPKKAAPKAHPGVWVRMYRHGLGDCLLVHLPRPGGSFYMMIDCGLIQNGGADAEARLGEAVEDIIATTGGAVDVLVVTHEHWDHVSGFSQHQELFGGLEVKALWLGWTENPRDRVAKQILEERGMAIRGLTAATQALMPLDAELAGGLSSLLGFFGVDFGAKEATGRTTQALENARKLCSDKPRYCRPDEDPWTSPELPGVRIYTLGPPRDPKMIKKLVAKAEIYHLADQGLSNAFFAAAAGTSPDARAEDPLEAYQPFDPAYRLPWSQLEALAQDPSDGAGLELARFFEERYFGLDKSADFPDQRWRRIDADAQVGNWLSWQDLSWTLDDGTVVTGPELLSRTVFYKVGHHGSHNATLKEKGLEQMTSEELVAFIPVDQAMAKKNRWGAMPLPGLVKALEAQTGGRVVRSDKDYGKRAGWLAQTDLYQELRL
jgi:hypothetical protein